MLPDRVKTSSLLLATELEIKALSNTWLQVRVRVSVEVTVSVEVRVRNREPASFRIHGSLKP